MSIRPNIDLVKPIGKYKVGTFRHDFTDESRLETSKSFKQSGLKRILTVQCWYPTNNNCTQGTKAPWLMDEALIACLSTVSKLPKFLLTNVSKTMTEAILDASISSEEKRYPVILFSHGYAGFIGQNTTLMMELASHGYVVCSIAHTYECFGVKREDGTIIPMDKNQMDQFYKNDGQNYISLLKSLKKCSEGERIRLEWNFLIENPMHVDIANVWIEDQKFIIEQLEKINGGIIKTPISGCLDLERIGALGHSFGGAVSVIHALNNKTIKAAINLDGVPCGDVTKQSNISPIMFINGTNRLSKDYTSGEVMNLSLFDRLEKDVYHVIIRDAYHMNFSDIAYITPLLKTFGIIGSVNNIRMQRVLNNLVVDFFNKYLNGKKSELLDSEKHDFSEVVVKKKI